METTKHAYKSRIKTNKCTGKSNLKKVNLLKKRIITVCWMTNIVEANITYNEHNHFSVSDSNSS